MPILSKVTPGKRNLTFIIVTGLVLGSFLGLYFLKYLPANKEELNNRGFRILRQISNNITEKNKEYKVRIKKILKARPTDKDDSTLNLYDTIKKEFKEDSKVKQILANKFSHLAHELVITEVERYPGKVDKPKSVPVCQTTISLVKNEDLWEQRYKTKLVIDRKGICITMESDLNKFLTNIINSRRDLFTYYVIMKDPHHRNDGDIASGKDGDELIYQSENLGLTNVADFDSIFSKKGNKSYGINTIDLSGTPYILFMQPVKWDMNHNVLIGLVKKSDYDAQYLSVSPGLIYTICIALLVLLCSLPFIKIILITQNEKLTVNDVVRVAVSLILGTAVLVIMLTDWFIFRTIKEKNRESLKTLTASVYSTFNKELKSSYAQLKTFDSIAVNERNFLLQQSSDSGNSLFTTSLQYKTFDQVFWVDNSGMQQAKWETSKNPSPLLDLRDRPYVRKILDSNAYEQIDGVPVVPYFIESIYSNITAEFKTMLAIKSAAADTANSLIYAYDRLLTNSELNLDTFLNKNPPLTKGSIFSLDTFLKNRLGQTIFAQLQNDTILKRGSVLAKNSRRAQNTLLKYDTLVKRCKVAVLSTRMFTEPPPILPREFGFCIINESGKVLIHSDLRRSLLENLIEETGNDQDLKQAIRRRQEGEFDNIIYYGDRHEFEIKPIPDLPMFLVTYYNKNALYNTNGRIISFALFVTVALFAFLLLTHRLVRFGNIKPSKLHFPMGKYNWFKPQQNSSIELLGISRFVLYYILFAAVYHIASALLLGDNLWVVLINILLLPFYTYLGIYTIKWSLEEPHKRAKTKHFHFLVIIIILNGLLYACSQNNTANDSHFDDQCKHVVVFQLFSMLFIGLGYMWFSRLVPKGLADIIRKIFYYWQKIPKQPRLLFNYSRSVILIVFVISVMPPVVLLYYAHNQEKIQYVKTHQLHLARDLQARNIQTQSRLINNKKYKEIVNTTFYNTSYLDTMKVDNNIYTRDMITPQTGSEPTRENKGPLFYEKLLSVIPKVESLEDTDYQLQTGAADNTWFWMNNDGKEGKNISLHFKGFSQQKFPVTIVSVIPSYLNALKSASLFVFIFLVIASVVMISIFLFIRKIAKAIFLIGYQNAFKTCCVEEVFFEKFSSFIKPEKLIILDEKNDFQKIVNIHTGLYEIVDLQLVTDPDMVLQTIQNSNKNVIILSNPVQDETLSKLQVVNAGTFDNDAWKVTFIVKPRNLKKGAKFPDELKYSRDFEVWGRKAIGSMSGYFELLFKNEYAKALHLRLENIEINGNASNALGNDPDARILEIQQQFEEIYEALWNACSQQEKFILHDFAQDEFVNFKNEQTINKLIRKGLITYEHDKLHIMNYSFRNFILSKSGTPDLVEIQKSMTKPGTWDMFKIGTLVAVISVALFVVLTQEDVFKQISTALTSVFALTTMLFNFLDQSKPLVKST